MKRNIKSLLVLLTLGLFLSCARAPQQLVSKKPIAPTVDLTSEKIRDSIVLIESENGSGTGFFVAPDKIATNTHVVAHAGPVSVKSPDKEKDWTIEGVVAFDTKNKLVILKIAGEGTPLPLADTVQIGASVFIPGHPDGEYKVTKSSIQSIRKSNRWLRLNTTTAKKTNGSPVLNNQGQVIGVIVPYGGYAVSSNVLEALLAEPMPMEPLTEWQQRKQVRAAVYYSLGKKKLDAKDYAGAIVDFDKVIEIDTEDADAYNNRGLAELRLGESETASGNAKKAQRLYKAAIEDITRSIQIDPEDADAYNNRGLAELRLGESETASGNAKKAQRLYKAAIEDITRSIQIDPEDADAYNNRGLAKFNLGESKSTRGKVKKVKKTQRFYNAAIVDYTQAVTMNPKYADAYENRAIARCKLGDIESARGDVEKRQRLYHEGVTDYDKSIQLDNPKDVDPKAVDLEFKKVGDSTVQVIGWAKTLGTFFGGSSFFVDTNKIATNIHVVAQPGAVFVKLRDKEKICAVEGVNAFDAENDLVILKIAGQGIPLSVGDSEVIQDGEPVVVVGYPDEKYKVVKGTIHNAPNSDKWFRMNPNTGSGSSGSPMLNNSGGQVVGIHAAGDKHYGYAIPSNALKALLAQTKPVEPLMEWQKRDMVRSYAYYIQGSSKRDDGHYKEALVDYNRSIEMNPQLFYGHYQRGRVQFKLGDYKSAIADYNKAIEIIGGVFNIYFSRGLAHIRLGDYESAIADYDKAIEFHPADANAYKKRVHAKFKLAESKTAQRDITGTLQLYQSAMDDCTQAIWLTPKDADVYDNRGWARFHLGESETARGNMKKAADLYKKAIEDYTQAIKLNLEHPHAYRNRAKAKFRLGNYGAAIIDLDKAIRINPKNAKYYYDRGRAKEALGQHEAAQADFQKAEALESDVGK